MNIQIVNTTILLKILEGLDSIDRRVCMIENRLDTISSYIENESKIQERRATYCLKKTLSGRYSHKIITESQLRSFYTPASNNIFTDFDGCVIAESPKGDGGVREGAGEGGNRAYILECKHCITKTIIDRKLKQFCTILDVFRNIKRGTITVRNPPISKFDNMVLSYNLQNFPDNITFLFVSDYISYEDCNFITFINTGKIDENKYNIYLLQYCKSHEVFRAMMDDKCVGQAIKSALVDATTVEDMVHILGPACNSEDAYERDKSTLNRYRRSLLNILVPFSSVKDYYKALVGHIGYYRFDDITLSYNV